MLSIQGAGRATLCRRMMGGVAVPRLLGNFDFQILSDTRNLWGPRPLQLFASRIVLAVGGGSLMTKAIAIALGVLLSVLAESRIVLAQAGATGGTIGKTDKSVSGGEEQQHQKARIKKRSPAAVNEPAVLSISGKWIWTAKCDDGSEWAGAFDLSQTSDGAVSGSANGNDGSGTMSGKLIGGKFTGSRFYLDHSTRMVFTAGRRSLDGSENSKSHGVCRYKAKRT
jgi:hypothetical protein